MNNQNTANLGRSRLIRQLARRITRHCKKGGDDAQDTSLVIGIFGEWGSGKSWILEQLALHFEKKEHRLLTTDGKEKALILPIRFNPWRFEAEEHLIVPLLMTAYDALNKQEVNNDKQLGDKLKEGASYFLKSSFAFASAWKFKIGLPGVGSCDFNPETALKAQEKLLSEDAVELTSHYYNFENQLKKVTADNLKLLFLIDDIDRCLPERAVQMLEAIKLFLDVPECVFVLGVDDEVVERGIRYRYRDYNNISPADAEQDSGAAEERDSLPPITGTEYLEKIIHLPIRLPLMRKRQVAALLEQRCPSLFTPEPIAEEGGELISRQHVGSRNEVEQLLELFEYAVPMIPRKLIRAAELLEFLCDLSERQPDKVLLARLVLLQLFAPEVFRHLRRTNCWLLQVWAGWQNDSGQKKNFRVSDFQEVKFDKSNSEAWSSEEEPLLHKLREAARNRVNFDPCRVLKGLAPETIPTNLLDYFHLVGEQEEEQVAIPAGEFIESAPVIEERLETARLTDQQGFIDDLFNEREASWRKALDLEELQGKILPADTFENILSLLNEEPTWRDNLLWLGSLTARLGWNQQDQLDTLCHWRNGFLDKIQDSTGKMQTRRQYGLLLGNTGWLPEDLDRFVRIAAGDFLYGEEKSKRNIPSDYWVAKYPVTNAQYKRFLDDKGYDQKELWSKEGSKWLRKQEEEIVQPRYWGNKELANPLFPVVGVNWYEALAYCRWLDNEIRKQPSFFGLTEENLTGFQTRLPTEHEWERAARGTDGREYSWGTEKPDATRINASSSWKKDEKASTTPVIMFKGGIRQENGDAFWDMSGNVWEWTASLDSDQYPYIRGGSWFNDRVLARCSVRGGDYPLNRLDYLGFRVVFSLAGS
jgi:formylglycine-generating enzyme required for sulfatase activity